jgi:hypothetical protein
MHVPHSLHFSCRCPQAISDELFAAFVSGEVDKVELVYTKFVSLITSDPIIQTLLPMTPAGELCNVDGTVSRQLVRDRCLPCSQGWFRGTWSRGGTSQLLWCSASNANNACLYGLLLQCWMSPAAVQTPAVVLTLLVIVSCPPIYAVR